MNSFDDYFNENFEDGLSSPSKYILRHSFEAGAQSRQAEIALLQKQVDELNKRIDNALKEFEENNDPWSMIVDEVIKTLKGNQS